MNPVGLAIVGLGQWAEVLARVCARTPTVRLVMAYSRNPERRQAFAQRWACRAAERLEAIWEADDVEGVLVTVPNQAHRAVVEAAARHGKGVLVEKPIAASWEDGMAIAEAVLRHRIVFACGHSARRLQGLRALKHEMERGTLGKVNMAVALFANERGLDLSPEDWRLQGGQVPGGPLTQLGIHHIDNLQYLLGPICKVWATASPVWRQQDQPLIAHVVCELAGGSTAYLGANWASPGTFALEVFGTRARGRLAVDYGWWGASEQTDRYSRLEVTELVNESGDRYRRSLTTRAVPLSKGDYLQEEIEEFAAALRGLARPEVGLKAALENLAVLLAAAESMQEGRPVAVREVPAAVG